LLLLVYWFWKLYDRPSKKQLELQEEKRAKRKEERMWQAIEVEMEKEREQTRSPEHKAELTRLKKLKLQVKSQLDKLL